MSALWMSVFKEPEPWQDACVLHDYAYWRGGTRLQRLQADKRLKERVELTGHKWWALFMYLSVRIGGSPYLPFGWRWAYGYEYGRFYSSRQKVIR